MKFIKSIAISSFLLVSLIPPNAMSHVKPNQADVVKQDVLAGFRAYNHADANTFAKYNFAKKVFRKTFFEKYVSKNIFWNIFFEIYSSKNIFRKIFFEKYFS